MGDIEHWTWTLRLNRSEHGATWAAVIEAADLPDSLDGALVEVVDADTYRGAVDTLRRIEPMLAVAHLEAGRRAIRDMVREALAAADGGR